MITEMIGRYAVRKNWCGVVAENLQDLRFNSPGCTVMHHWSLNNLYDERTRLQKVIKTLHSRGFAQ